MYILVWRAFPSHRVESHLREGYSATLERALEVRSLDADLR